MTDPTERFVSIVQQEFSRPTATSGSRVGEDLGFDSLLLLELLVVLEIHLEKLIDPGAEDLSEMTLAELYEFGMNS